MSEHRAILLIGPTGSGKTPLGEVIERRGLWGFRHAHFDFGAQLRAAAAGNRPADMSDAEFGVIQRSLQTGALLEDHQFPIAAKILRAFAAERLTSGRDVLILNGLPRHVGQARDIDAIVNIGTVINLRCTPQVVYERIRLNSGGDRAHRIDDSIEEITRKLEVFCARTMPLLKHYEAMGVPIHQLDIGVNSTAEELWTALQSIRRDWQAQEKGRS